MWFTPLFWTVSAGTECLEERGNYPSPLDSARVDICFKSTDPWNCTSINSFSKRFLRTKSHSLLFRMSLSRETPESSVRAHTGSLHMPDFVPWVSESLVHPATSQTTSSRQKIPKTLLPPNLMVQNSTENPNHLFHQSVLTKFLPSSPNFPQHTCPLNLSTKKSHPKILPQMFVIETLPQNMFKNNFPQSCLVVTLLKTSQNIFKICLPRVYLIDYICAQSMLPFWSCTGFGLFRLFESLHKSILDLEAQSWHLLNTP